MAKLLSTMVTTKQEPKRRFFAISYVGRCIRMLDTESGNQYTIEISSADEAIKMLNLTDDEWVSWLAAQGGPA